MQFSVALKQLRVRNPRVRKPPQAALFKPLVISLLARNLLFACIIANIGQQYGYTRDPCDTAPGKVMLAGLRTSEQDAAKE